LCPLCGRFVSLRFFDPGSFESDIYGVDVRGLGRGKGVEVVSRFSVLNTPEIVVPIRNRCLELIRIIDRKHPQSRDELIALQRDVQTWKKNALDLQRQGNDLQALVVDMESDMLYWRKETQKMKKLYSDLEAKIANDETTIRSWMNRCDKLNDRVKDLSMENKRLAKKIESMEEEEELAVEEMDEILEMINSSANTDFEYLVDAVEFLLEVG
jgi:predicted  nucleic acid-binding Zn-ribbon protein